MELPTTGRTRSSSRTWTTGSHLGSLTGNYRAGDLTLYVGGPDTSGPPPVIPTTTTPLLLPARRAAEHEQYDAFSQEVRLLTNYDSPINFMFGAYYQHTKLDFINSSKILALAI